jgi:hypothetical protein
MSINFKKFMSDIKRGVKGTVEDFSGAAKSKKEQKRKYEQLIRKTTKKKFVEKYGEKEYNKSMEPGGLRNTQTNRRKKIRKAQEKKYASLK